MLKKYTTVKMSDALFMLAMVTVLAFPGPSRLKALSIIAFFGYMMVLKVMHWRDIKNNLHLVGSFLFLGYAFLSKRWALYPAGVSEQINNVLWTVLLSTAISTYVIYRDLSVKDIADRLVIIALLFCVNVLLNGSFNANRLSIGINENSFGRLCSGMACFFLYQCKQERWKNIFLDVLTAMFVLFAFLSGSRTSVLMVSIYVLAFLIFEHPTENLVKLMGRLVLIVVLCVVGYFAVTRIDFLYRTIGNRLEAFVFALAGLAEGDGSYITRMRMMETARTIFREHPLIGIGLNNFKFYTYHNTYAHSNYYELAACLGIVGLTAYYAPLLVYARRAFSQWKKDLPEKIVPLAIMVAIFAGDMGTVFYFNVIMHVFVGIAVGLINTCVTQASETRRLGTKREH